MGVGEAAGERKRAPIPSVGVAALLALVCLISGCGIWGGEARQSLKAGEAAFKQGDLKMAIAHFRQAVEQAPSSPSAHTRRAELAELLGEFDEALEAYDTAARLDPSPTSFFRVGALADRIGNTSAAVEWLRASLAGQPPSREDSIIDWPRWLLFGFRVRREDVTERLFQMLVEAGEDDEALKLARGEGWIREGLDYCQEALGNLSDETEMLLAMLRHPRTADCTLTLGKRLTEGGLVRLARLVLNDRVQNSQDPETRAEAVTFLRNRLPPHDVAKLAESLNAVGYNLQHSYKQPAEAIAVYQRAIAADHSFSWPYSNLANVLGDQKQIDQAMEWYRRALAVNPNHWYALYNMGWTAFRAERYPDALVLFREAVARDPESAAAHSNLGRVLLNLDREAEGIRELQTAVRIRPNHWNDESLLDGRVGADPRRGPTPHTAYTAR